MKNKAYLLVVEDESEISWFLESTLQDCGYDVSAVNSGQVALKMCSSRLPDAVILDLGLPDVDGKNVLQSLRSWSQVPVIVLSARHQESEKVAALNMGADDYLTKPFGTAELLARIKVALRHNIDWKTSSRDVYLYKGLSCDLEKRKIRIHDKELQLTPTEYSLLSAMVRKAGHVVTRQELLRTVWGKAPEDNDHYLHIYIQRLRQKLGDDPLYPKYVFTEPGIGYRLSTED